MYSPRTSIVRAVTFRVLTELVRRHSNLPIRILELHPTQSGYDCLTLWRDGANGTFPGTVVAHFNTASENVTVFRPVVEPPTAGSALSDSMNYIDRYLLDPRSTLEILEELCGFPSREAGRVPTSSRMVLVYRVISELLERSALSSRQLDVRSGWFDSDYDECHVRPELRPFRGARAAFQPNLSREATAAIASDFWMLSACDALKTTHRTTPMAIDVSGKVWTPDRDDAVVDVWQLYSNNGRRLLPIVTELERITHAP